MSDPVWEDQDERLYEQRFRREGFDAKVDRLMAVGGLDRDEAEVAARAELERPDPFACVPVLPEDM